MKTFRMGLRLGLLAGMIAALVLALQSRRRSRPDARDATGVHGDWPAVTRRPGAAPPEPAGDHHPHGRVAVPMEAAAMGAPAVADPARPTGTEPLVPEPRERLDQPDPHPGSLPHVEPSFPTRKAGPAKKEAAKKVAATKAEAVKKVAAARAEAVKKVAKKALPAQKAPAEKALPAEKAVTKKAARVKKAAKAAPPAMTPEAPPSPATREPPAITPDTP